MPSSLATMALVALSHAISATALATPDPDPDALHTVNAFDKRGGGFEDSFKIYLRKRNAHACMMSIVFIVLFPLAAISLHLPLKNTRIRVVSHIHAPIQLLGLSMMIGAMGLGIDLARNDLHYLGPGATIKAHVVIGLTTTSAIILFQPALGLLQHRHFRRTGQKSVFGHVHRWLGRVTICLGWINAGLGYQLVGIELATTSSLTREFVLMGLLAAIWYGLVAWDGWRSYVMKRDRLPAYGLGWRKGRGLVLEKAHEKDQEKVDGEVMEGGGREVGSIPATFAFYVFVTHIFPAIPIPGVFGKTEVEEDDDDDDNSNKA